MKTALTAKKYNPLSRKNQNDIIDAEQLVYFADPSLAMLTCDKAIKAKVAGSAQAARIITARADELRDLIKAEALLRSNLS